MRSSAALNLATLGPFDLEQKLYAASRAGFAAVGLSREEVAEAGEQGIEELHMSDLSVAELTGCDDWMEPSRTARALALVQAEETFRLAAQLGCSVVIAWPRCREFDPVAAAAHFSELCRTAEPFAVRVGLEFIGQSRDVGNLEIAWEIVEAAEQANGGLVIDSFHFHRGGSTVEMLEPVPAEKIFLVQVSDAPPLPLRELDDGHRIYPGSGAIALEPLLAALRGKGYSGYYSLELHNEAYWQEDPMVVATEALRSMQRLDIV